MILVGFGSYFYFNHGENGNGSNGPPPPPPPPPPTAIWDKIQYLQAGANPVIPTGTYDSGIREIGNVLYEPWDTGKEYKITYSAFGSGYGTKTNPYIAYAYSSDGVNWIKHGLIITSRSIEDPYIVKVDGVYHLFAEDKTGYVGNERPIRKMHANNMAGPWIDDGIVLSNLDSDAGIWEDALVGSPIVFYDNGVWKMIYEGYREVAHGYLGFATSNDGRNWVRYANNPVFSPAESGWDNMQVVCDDLWKENDRYYMSYHGYNGVTQRFGLCYSTNLISWIRHPNNPIGTSGLGPDCMTIYTTEWRCYVNGATNYIGIFLAYPKS